MTKPFGAPSTIKKRSIVVGDRKTSISLENEFWEDVKSIAHARGQTLKAFVTDVVTRYDGHDVSSALRLSALEHVRATMPDPQDSVSEDPAAGHP